MRQFVARMFVSMVIVPFAFAGDALPPPQPQLILNKINFQVSAKQWVTTQSALLNVSINMTMSNADLVAARADMMQQLNKIAKGDWHLVEFDRSRDSSGLEKLYVQAQARINQEALTDIYKNANSVSVAGAKYEISAVDFKPSFEETQVVLAKVREQLYQQVNDEIARINKAYPTQNFTVSNLVFVEGNNPSPPRPYQAKEMNAMVTETAVPAPVLAVSNELILTALVEAAANRKQ